MSNNGEFVKVSEQKMNLYDYSMRQHNVFFTLSKWNCITEIMTSYIRFIHDKLIHIEGKQFNRFWIEGKSNLKQTVYAEYCTI